MNISRNVKKKFFSKDTGISILVIFFVFIFDRFSKIKIINNEANNQNIFINDYLNFELVWNTGIGFGLFSQNANLYYQIGLELEPKHININKQLAEYYITENQTNFAKQRVEAIKGCECIEYNDLKEKILKIKK